MMPTEPSTRESSSTAVTYSTYPIPAPPKSCGKMTPINPSLPSSLIVESGNSPASSHLRTLGAISRSANSRTLFLSCSSSSLSWKSKSYSSGRRKTTESTEDHRDVRSPLCTSVTSVAKAFQQLHHKRARDQNTHADRLV